MKKKENEINIFCGGNPIEKNEEKGSEEENDKKNLKERNGELKKEKFIQERKKIIK